jgi:two-component SAPR family response regulator
MTKKGEIIHSRVGCYFGTAYDRYAMRAFEAHAADYLPKPFHPDRFMKAVERARARLAAISPTMISIAGCSLFRLSQIPQRFNQ